VSQVESEAFVITKKERALGIAAIAASSYVFMFLVSMGFSFLREELVCFRDIANETIFFLSFEHKNSKLKSNTEIVKHVFCIFLPASRTANNHPWR